MVSSLSIVKHYLDVIPLINIIGIYYNYDKRLYISESQLSDRLYLIIWVSSSNSTHMIKININILEVH
uniref:Uncharacterized protein n=1 Tax=Myoviridae sp. ctIty1 TaxID=2827673 RepID=A0A8S5TGZ7_9CAUD|nr:MAG TPA: hypothetical protein [Myoviridae sp. ctIty1]